MIKFFRTIRQKMIKENRVSKYLLYAIGEIILVIIGILIALAINERSQKQSDLRTRNLYVLQLSDEADRNLKQLSTIESNTNDMIKEMDTLIELIKAKDYDNPKLLSKSRLLIRVEGFQPVTITYENLKFSGDLKLFEDLELRNTISQSYDTFSDVRGVEEIDRKGALMYYENFLMPKVSFWDMHITSERYAQEIIFQNMVLARRITLVQNRDAYRNSIESLNKLKATFAELQLGD